MNYSADLRRLLQDWPYDPDNPARIAKGEDGREILQVRTPLGIEQLELQGRPDGQRPYGMESALDYQLQRLANISFDGREAEFELTAEECAELFSEGTIFYFRYLHLFQLRRWSEVVRDTTRNLRLFDFAHRHAARQEDQDHLEKWRPYLLRMNAVAAASLSLELGDVARAHATLQEALERMASLVELDDETFRFELNRSQTVLREVLAQVEQLRPVSPLERLEKELNTAIERQEFERAAVLRDRIRELRE